MQETASAPRLGSFCVLLWALGGAGCPSPGVDEPARDTDAPAGSMGSTSEDDTTGTTGAPATTGEPTTSMSTDDVATGATESTESTSTGDPETTGTSGGPGEECGDGVVEPELGEECDDGPANNNNAACTGACKKNVCGDHFVHVGVEECDDGINNDADKCGGCDPATCTFGPYCGDGKLDAVCNELCDGEVDPSHKGCADDCWFDKEQVRLVFITDAMFSGDLVGHLAALAPEREVESGVEAADWICHTLAAQAGLIPQADDEPLEPSFRAWLSAAGQPAASRLAHHELTLLLPNGVVVAEGWAELTSGSLQNPINLTPQFEVTPGNALVWTNSLASGAIASPTDDCLGWTSNSFAFYGRIGFNGGVSDGLWTHVEGDNGSWSCVSKSSLYCMEQ
ncbi:MAG: hypothetical protein R3A51_21200 [Nannocystaceae bacterium]